jgi:NAD-dependent dihydropyrimidine dehydrogenase PreA subunit
VPYVIAAACIDVMDRSCVEECPVDCIYEGERKLYINPSECIDCGACEPACPVQAISQARRADAGRPSTDHGAVATLALLGQPVSNARPDWAFHAAIYTAMLQHCGLPGNLHASST